jgi:hypothetical protein
MAFRIVLEHVANAGVEFRKGQTDIREEDLAEGEPVRGPDNQKRHSGGEG